MAKRRKTQQTNKQAVNANQLDNSEQSDPPQDVNNPEHHQNEEAKQQQVENDNQTHHKCVHCSNHPPDATETIENTDTNQFTEEGGPQFNIQENVEFTGAQNNFKNNNSVASAQTFDQNNNNNKHGSRGSQNAQSVKPATMQTQHQPQNNKVPVWNKAAQNNNNNASQPMGPQQYKRQYQQQNSEHGYGKQPVVTMHELIDQEERQKTEAQQQQRINNQSQATQENLHSQPLHQTDNHNQKTNVEVEADEEEGEEESEEEDDDTDEEGCYGPEDAQDDELSDEIEDEHSWASSSQQHAQNHNHQQQPGVVGGGQGGATQGAFHKHRGQPCTGQHQHQTQQNHPNQKTSSQQANQASSSSHQQYQKQGGGGSMGQQHTQQYQHNNNSNSNASSQQQQQNSGVAQGHRNHGQRPQQNSQNNNQNNQNNQQQQQQQRQQQQQNNNTQAGSASNTEDRLHQYLTDMLINLYNGKATDEYRDHYAQVVTILDDQKKIQEQSQEKPSITILSLQQLFETKIQNIVGTVRDKLQEDAKKDNLVQEIDMQPEVPQEEVTQDTNQVKRKLGTTLPGEQKQMKAKEYRGDLQKNFDEILSAVGDYFDLFKNNTDKLEALWLQLLEYVDVGNSNQCRIFRHLHYSIYIRIVIKNKTIMAIINEAKRWNNTSHASKALKEHLDKIKQIETDSHAMIPETYENFNKRSALEFDLNEYTCTDFVQKQQQLERQQQQAQTQQQSMRGQTQGSNTEGGSQANTGNTGVACKQVFQDCIQFKNHQRQTQGSGKCNCRCLAKNCSKDHFNASSGAHQRGAQQKRANDKRQQTRKNESQPAEIDYADEKVYNKNIDDLMDYIMQPQQDGKKNKKKTKNKRKGVDDLEDELKVKFQPISSVQSAFEAQPLPIQQQESFSSGQDYKTQQQSVQPEVDTPNQPFKQWKKPAQNSSNQRQSSSEKEGGAKREKSRSPSTVQPCPARNSSSVKNDRAQRNKSQKSEPWPDVTTCSSDQGSNDELVRQQKSDLEFEAEIADFARLLERNCAQQLVAHARKLRPNYEEQWIMKLKLRLQNLESKKPSSNSSQTASSNSQSGKTAPPTSGFSSRKH